MPSQRYASPTLKTRISVIALVASAVSVAAYAATPVEIQKERHEHFEALGDAFKAVRDNTKGSPDFAALDKAVVVIEKASKDMGNWFPQGTGPEAGKTRALPEVWSKSADFSAAQKQFAEKVPALSAAVKAKDADAVGKAFKDVGGACKNCHETFRAPE
ncbi:MAG TPA: cytochrome c [Steroidobacteraceae bacterium]|nr:cytochrome c [Steroidobacteraceae bacterium]